MQFVQPIFHMAEGAEQVEAGLVQVQSGVQSVFKLLPLDDARQLLGFGRPAAAARRVRCRAVSQFELRQTRSSAAHRQSAVSGAISAWASSSRRLPVSGGNLEIVLMLGLLGFGRWRAAPRRQRLLGLGAKAKSKKGTVNWRPKLTLFGVKFL